MSQRGNNVFETIATTQDFYIVKNLSRQYSIELDSSLITYFILEPFSACKTILNFVNNCWFI